MDTRNNRNEEDDKLFKKHSVSKRQISEIARKLKINKRLHPDDATTLYCIVQKLIKENYSPVLLYKPQGDDEINGPTKMKVLPMYHDLFLFALQMKEQLEMFQKSAGKVVCIDSTHGTN